ncbi:MAG TPA: ZPR1 zinc finger domain-containing protein [Methanocella sp.]|nr:ZPR1 zinc finger domain-containing protein [Methanocella sp.]
MKDLSDENYKITSTHGTITCPVCNNMLEMRWHQDSIPYFGDVMEISSVCVCGFKYADTLILGQHDPLRHSFKVCSEGHMCTRVIRSTSGTMRIPEWGVDIEPGPASEGYISNVEGVLDRIESVVNMAHKWAETPDELEKANCLLKAIDDARGGKSAFTLVIEDPLGNSAIVGNEVRVERLSPDYAERLNTGMFIIKK